MPTKKQIKSALRYAMQTDDFNCESCREEMLCLMQDIGLAMRGTEVIKIEIKVENKHFVYKQTAEDHKGVPMIQPKKRPEQDEVEEG